MIDGKTGSLVDEGNLEQTVERWLDILGDKDLASQMGKQGRDHVLSTSSLDSMTMGYTQLIESLYDGCQSDDPRLAPYSVSLTGRPESISV